MMQEAPDITAEETLKQNRQRETNFRRNLLLKLPPAITAASDAQTKGLILQLLIPVPDRAFQKITRITQEMMADACSVMMIEPPLGIRVLPWSGSQTDLPTKDHIASLQTNDAQHPLTDLTPAPDR